ncbi:hypothetical protein GF420_07455 [candidate division GN15 bacterium]|nr:hypothetical protein [candidate division GN15 bacterium]
MLTAAAATVAAAGDVLVGRKVQVPAEDDNRVRHQCLSCSANLPVNEPVNGMDGRSDRWSLPASTMAPNDTTIHCLVLRFNFQPDNDPNTTGDGRMVVVDPRATPADSAAYFDSIGHWVDPPPHDSAYFHAHMRALDIYWESVSGGAVNLTWDIFPNGDGGLGGDHTDTSTYQLPDQMNQYGICSNNLGDVIGGLEKYFIDCLQLADTAHLIDPVKYPDIDFSQYGAIFLFHAGSDRQNDIGFPQTCSDLFTGFIKISDDLAVTVDNGAMVIGEALMMPETAAQDNRATALNAVLAHEFGHQLGLVDLYDTRNFLSQLGDFALMDNNGFGTGVDFGFPVGTVFGTLPLMPMAWSRAYLGFDEVLDVRNGDDIRVVAAAAQTSGRKVVRIPITEKEYYLIENRVEDFAPNPAPTFEQPIRVDSVSNVFLGPVEVTDTGLAFTGEYDALVAGNGMAIFHVDESVAALPAAGSGNPQFPDDLPNRFEANQLQWIPDRRFISLVEADGLVDFGGYYRRGFGSDADLFREDRANSFTPNTNPPAFDNTDNNTHVYVTDIRRDSAGVPASLVLDTVIVFDVETDKLASGFPVRCQLPFIGLSPVADDIDGDGTDEIIVVSSDALFVFTTDGGNFIHRESGCDPCVTYFNTAGATVNPGIQYPVPLYALLSDTIFSGPVTGDFGDPANGRLIAVGSRAGAGGTGRVSIFEAVDGDLNGQADLATGGLINNTIGIPVALSFGERLWVLTGDGYVYRKDSLAAGVDEILDLSADEYHGICQVGGALCLMSGDSIETNLTVITPDPGGGDAETASFGLGEYYQYGPITVDVDRSGQPEIVCFSDDGRGILVTVDTTGAGASFTVLERAETDLSVTTNPVAADINDDGYPEIIVGGVGFVYAFNRNLTLVTEYPLEVNDRFPEDNVIASPVIADIETGGQPETVFPTEVGNVYSFGEEPTFGFPVAAGELGTGSSVVYHDSTGGYVGYLGADGWFYSWEVNADTVYNYWPMFGADPSGSLEFNNDKLGSTTTLSDSFDENRFYNYPNPVLDGRTTFRYYLSEAPNRVTLTVYDLTGEEITSLEGPTMPGVDNEVDWYCGDVTPGVYRCRIEVEYGGDTKTTFTDVAVIR